MNPVRSKTFSKSAGSNNLSRTSNGMKTILIDARESGTSTGRYVDKLVEYLHKLQPIYEIIILTKPHRLAFFKNIAPKFRAVSSPFKEFTFSEQIGLLKQVKALKPDLVHFTMVQQPVLYRGRVVTTMHDLTTIRFRNPAKNSFIFTIKQIIYKWVNKRVAKKSVQIITPTQFVKDDVRRFTGINQGKIIVTHEAADKITDKLSPITQLKNKRFIMYVGRPMPHKNLEHLVEAFVLLQKTHPDLWLVLAGKKDVLYERHEKMVQERGIKNVLFTGFVSEGRLRWLYENTAGYIFPSLSEGFGLPGLEAMIHGAPVISSDATCLPEIYDGAALYFDCLDPGDIAFKIASVLDNKKLADNLRTKGQAQAQKFSWHRMAAQTLKVYKQALDEK